MSHTEPSIEFFDVLDKHTIDLCCNLMNNPFEFFTKGSNFALVTSHRRSTPDLISVFSTVKYLQYKMQSFKDKPLYEQIVASISHVPICSDLIEEKSKSDNLKLIEFNNRVNLNLVEDVNPFKAWENSRLFEPDELKIFVSLMSSIVWLNEHISMVLLSLANVTCVNGNTFEFRVENRKIQHLHNCWFGVALDNTSLHAADAKMLVLKESFKAKASRKVIENEAFIDAMTIFPQHWRVPCDTESFIGLLWHDLISLIKLTIFGLEKLEENRSFTKADLHVHGYLDTYLTISNCKPLQERDRLFQEDNNGIRLSNRKFAHSLICSAEAIAKAKLGEEWHNKASVQQKDYFYERLKSNENVQVFMSELTKDDVEDSEIRIDVDCFVKHKNTSIIYAVQLKHLENSFKCGLSDWLSFFRSNKKLRGGVDQLVNLANLIESDETTRSYLRNLLGINNEELKKIVPVVVQNIGSLDFWRVNAGILIYDINTFCNVLNGHEYTFMEKKQSYMSRSGGAQYDETVVSPLSKPKEVIDAYLSANDRLSGDLKNYNYAADVYRELRLDDYKFKAIGLGL